MFIYSSDNRSTCNLTGKWYTVEGAQIALTHDPATNIIKGDMHLLLLNIPISTPL